MLLVYIGGFFLFAMLARALVRADEARRDSERLLAELRDAHEQLRTYAERVEELAVVEERNRLAREIHDNLGHYLTVVNVQIRAAQAIMADDPQKAQEALGKAQRLTQDGLDAVRQSVSALRESPLGNLSLVQAVKALCDDTQNSGIVVDPSIHGDVIDLDPNLELTLYRAVQEGLTNVRKHARASCVDLTLDFSDASLVTLTIADNGAGAAEDSQGGYGLLGIQERVELLGGTMHAGSSPGEGFVLTISLPLEQPALAGDTAVSAAV